MTDEVDRIIKGLSSAQRLAIISAMETLDGRFRVSAKVHWSVRVNLTEKGLAVGYFLTSLGLQVRDRLISMKGDAA